MSKDLKEWRLRKSALEWMASEGPLLIDLNGQTANARMAAANLMPVCNAMAADGLCTEDCASEFISVFAITDAGREAVAPT